MHNKEQLQNQIKEEIFSLVENGLEEIQSRIVNEKNNDIVKHQLEHSYINEIIMNEFFNTAKEIEEQYNS